MPRPLDMERPVAVYWRQEASRVLHEPTTHGGDDGDYLQADQDPGDRRDGPDAVDRGAARRSAPRTPRQADAPRACHRRHGSQRRGTGRAPRLARIPGLRLSHPEIAPAPRCPHRVCLGSGELELVAPLRAPLNEVPQLPQGTWGEMWRD